MNKSKEIIKKIQQSENFDHNQYNILIPNDTNIRRKLSSEIILRRYPRIDRKVTMDTRRVSRIPYSVHGKTGQIAIIIKDMKNFYPDSAPTIWETMM
ncbi:MAG: DNA primase small subunit domain-containing protein [Candidatus Heimdallarchaeaceae archaeon]